MINSCSCTRGGETSSSKNKKNRNSTRRANSKPCKNCTKKPTVVQKLTQSENMLSSSNNVGVELPRVIGPCVNWKTATRGRQRAVRRARTSFTGDNNRGKIVTTSSNGSDNGTDEEFKGTDRDPVSESEKLGVTILGRRFSDAIQNVPIKKRRCLLVASPSPPPICLHSNPESGLAFGEKSLNDNNQVDFSGISILADAACESDMVDSGTKFPVPEFQPPKGENGIITPLETPQIAAHKGENGDLLKNDGLDKSSKAENPSRDSRFKWDLNTVMEAWECDEQDVFVADVAGENVICKDANEGLGIICHERMSGGTKGEDQLKESLELSDVGLKDEGGITQVGPEECIVESNVSQVELNGVDLNSLSQPAALSASKEEDREDEINPSNPNQSCVSEGVLKLCVSAGTEEKVANSPTIHEPCKVDLKVVPTTEEPELFSEKCTNLLVLPNVSNQNDAVESNFTDSGQIKMGDDIAGRDATQLTSSIVAPLIEADIENGGVLKPNDDKVPATDDPIVGGDARAELSIDGMAKLDMKKNENGGSSLDVCKDMGIQNKKTDGEEDEYQYEDGELREPIIDYWATGLSDESRSEHGACESDKQENHHPIEPPQNDDAPAADSLDPLPRQGENDAQPKIKDDWDAEMIEKPDLENKDADERPKNGWVLNGGKEYASSSSRVKRTGWDRLPESSRKNGADSPEGRAGALYVRRDSSSSRLDSRPRSFDGPRRSEDKSFARPRRSEEDEHIDSIPNRRLDGPRPLGRHRDEQWTETRPRAGSTRHKSPPEFSAPSYAPSNSGNATAASIAKVKNNGFIVAPDGTLVKATGSGPTSSRSSAKCPNSLSFSRGVCLSRERDISPQRFHVGRPKDGPYRRPVTDVCSRRGNVIHHLSPPLPHVASRSRSRTRSPNAWISPARRGPGIDRGRSPPRRMGPAYEDRVGGYNHNHVLPHGARWVDDTRRTPPCIHSPLPRRLRGEEYHHHHHPPMHTVRCNGYDRREYEEARHDVSGPRRHFNRQKVSEFQRRGSPRGFVRRAKDERDNGFKFGRGGRGRGNNGRHKHYDMRDSGANNGDDDASMRRLS